jgi:hypothetical protein
MGCGGLIRRSSLEAEVHELFFPHSAPIRLVTFALPQRLFLKEFGNDAD